MGVQLSMCALIFCLCICRCELLFAQESTLNEKNKSEIIPVEVLFKTELKSDFKVSTDGKFISYIGSNGRTKNIFVWEIGTSSAIQITDFSITTILDFYWASGNHLVFTCDTNRDRNFRVYSVDIQTKKTKCLTDFPDSYSRIISLNPNNQNEIIIHSNKRDPKITDIYIVNIQTRGMKILYEGSLDSPRFAQYYIDNSGQLRLGRTFDGIKIFNLQKGEFEDFLIFKGNEDFRPKYFSHDNNRVYAYSKMGRDKYALVEFDIKNKNEVNILLEDPDYDVFSWEERNDDIFPCADFYVSNKMNKVLYAYYCGDNYKGYYPDSEIESIIKKAKRKYGDYNIILESYSDNLEKIILNLFSDRVKGIYYLYDKEKDTFEHLHTLSGRLDENNFSEVMPVEYNARDGLKIHGYVTVPKGMEPQNLPVVACIHGGPTLRDTPGYNDIVQFFANRGYLVLQVNYRGSDGYGSKFTEAGYKQLGVKTHNDIIDGLNWLIEKGMADKSRIAFYGFSSGGYEAVAGIMNYPDYYACAIGISGLVNLSSTFSMLSKKFQERWGEPERDSLMLYNTSPLFHTEKIKTPLMMINGVKDFAIPIDEIDRFVELLKQQGNEVEYLRYENEGHNIIYNPELKVEVFKQIDTFLEKYIGRQK
ncbi:S9 family peptidase [Bacteroidota bacterium]